MKCMEKTGIELLKSPSIEYMEKYLLEIRNQIFKVINNSQTSIDIFVEIVKQVKIKNKELMFLETQHDSNIVSHACADYIKFNQLKVLQMGMPEITALGNDYPYPYNYVESLKHRNFGNGNVLVGIQFGVKSSILNEAFEYNYQHGGINVLVTNEPGIHNNVATAIFIPSSNNFISGDIAQLIFHYVSAHLAYETKPDFFDEGAQSFKNYCSFLLQSILDSRFSIETLIEIALKIKQKLMNGNSVYAFGNGGSASIASYFVDALSEICKGSFKPYKRIHDITSLKRDIIGSIHNGSYKSDVFTKIMDQFGVDEDDILLGISSSGNSENILHPFLNFPQAIRIGILGFDDGGKIGKNNANDIALIVPDHGDFLSYQRAEDGQRIALSSILYTLEQMGVGI